MEQIIANISPEHEAYLTLLYEIPQKPALLHIWGSFPKTTHYISIVGTRRATPYGIEMTQKIISGLRGQDITIVSGLALGIDAVAHHAALAVGLPTIAVIGSGLSPEVLYPARNKQLASSIVAHGGCIISEYPHEMRAAQWTFPQRNRIVAGLSHATIVIEAPQKSGALITSRLATEYNRDVGAVPGSVFSDNATGPHMLLKNGAALITSSDDVLAMLGIAPVDTDPATDMTDSLLPDEKVIYDCLGTPQSIDEVIRASQLDTVRAQSAIGMMEIRGIIKRIGSTYVRNL